MLAEVNEEIEKAFDVERQPTRRNLSLDELVQLRAVCQIAFGEDINPQVLKKIINYCLYVERFMQGRAAGDIVDLVIRYFVRYFSSANQQDSDNINHGEIGVLFGATTIYSHHAAKLAGVRPFITVIDPFSGYYGKNRDDITGLPVDLEIFKNNLSRFNIPSEEIEIIVGLSTDDDVIDRIGNREFISLIIDGDHSYEGLKADWSRYKENIVVGGYVLIDDYNNPAWPEVTRYVNKEIFPNLNNQWEVVLVFGYSLVLKRNAVGKESEKNFAATYLSRIAELENLNKRLESRLKTMRSVVISANELSSLSWRTPFRKILAIRRLTRLIK